MTKVAALPDGRPVEEIEISAGGLTASVLTFGAILRSVQLRSVDRNLTHVPADIDSWISGNTPYHGALVAPVANRFTRARAPLGGRDIQFEANQAGLHALHSGAVGTHAKLWDVVERQPDAVTLAVELPDGEGSFPGNRRVTARFSVVPPGTLRLEIGATSDALTFFNATNHSYWNLDGSVDWTGHTLRIAADHYLPTTDTFAPTGEIAAVDGAMDFRETRAPSHGEPPLDHNFCLSGGRTGLREVLWLTGQSGVTLTMATTEAGMQVYDGRDAGYPALALEAQGWPDAPNHEGFPGIELQPGDDYHAVTEWRFAQG